MNRLDLVNYVSQQSQMAGAPGDATACQNFLSKRYELIYNSYLWKDTLTMVNVPFDPVNNQDNADGICLLPEVIDRVVALRTSLNSVRIHGLEDYYRIDYDAFNQGITNPFGTSAEFAILSPIWFVWRGALGLKMAYGNSAADTLPCKVTWRDETGKRFVQLLNNAALLNSSNARSANLIPANATYSGGGYPVYSNGPLVVGKKYVWIPGANEISGPFGTGIVPAIFTAPSPAYAFQTASPVGSPVTGYIGLPVVSRLEIETVFKPATTSTVSVSPQAVGDVAGGTMQPTDTASPKYQRIRLFSIPQGAITLNVLGKKPFIPLDFDQEVPAIKNLDNVLIAFTLGDMLRYARQYGKSQQLYTEGAALLRELALLEVVQGANNTRIIPESGYGDPYFSAGRGYGFEQGGIY